MDREDRLGKAVLKAYTKAAIECWGVSILPESEDRWEDLPQHTKDVWKKVALAGIKEDSRIHKKKGSL